MRTILFLAVLCLITASILETDATPATSPKKTNTSSKTGAASPGQHGPASPGKTGPASPGKTGPASPGKTGPASPGKTRPASPGKTGPVSPGKHEPAAGTVKLVNSPSMKLSTAQAKESLSKSKDTKSPTKSKDTKSPTKSKDTKSPTKSKDTKSPTKSKDTKSPSKSKDTKSPSKSVDTKSPTKKPSPIHINKLAHMGIGEHHSSVQATPPNSPIRVGRQDSTPIGKMNLSDYEDNKSEQLDNTPEEELETPGLVVKADKPAGAPNSNSSLLVDDDDAVDVDDDDDDDDDDDMDDDRASKLANAQKSNSTLLADDDDGDKDGMDSIENNDVKGVVPNDYNDSASNENGPNTSTMRDNSEAATVG